MRLCLLALLAGVAMPAFALEYPAPEHPGARALLARYQADAALLARPDLMTMPATALAWPCEVPEVDQYKLAGLAMAHPQLRAAHDKATRKLMRENGLDAKPALMEYSEIRIVPLRAQCENGKLHGEVEVVASYVMKSYGETSLPNSVKPIEIKSVSVVRSQRRQHMRARGGELLRQSMAVEHSSSTTENTYSDAAMGERIRKQHAELGLDKPFISQSVTYVEEDGATGVFSVTEGANASGKRVPMLNSTLILPLDERRGRMLTYMGKQLLSESTMKDGKEHGLKLGYMENILKKHKNVNLSHLPGMENAREVVINGVDMLETRQCMQNGLEVKTLECPSE